jgi:hypothetical protein
MSEFTADVTQFHGTELCDECGHPTEFAQPLSVKIFAKLGLPARRPSCPVHQEDVGGVGSVPCMCKSSGHYFAGLKVSGTSPVGPT